MHKTPNIDTAPMSYEETSLATPVTPEIEFEESQEVRDALSVANLVQQLRDKKLYGGHEGAA